jgi:uncharacterized protein (DUF488 family)
MKLFTIGYGGRTPGNFLGLLKQSGVRAVVDVRLRPDRANRGIWARAKLPHQGIARLLGEAGIEYHSLVELGNLFAEFEDWQERYRRLLERCGDLLLERLAGVPEPFCLLCAEQDFRRCHREQIAEHLARTRGAEVEHLG